MINPANSLLDLYYKYDNSQFREEIIPRATALRPALPLIPEELSLRPSPAFHIHRRKPINNRVVIKSPEDLAIFKDNWVRKAWKDSVVRVQVYGDKLYSQLHCFLGTYEEEEIQSGGYSRVLKAGNSNQLVMKRSSPRKFSINSKENLELVDINETEFAFYEDIQRREKEIQKNSRGKPNFPKVKLLLTSEHTDPRYSGAKSYAILMENLGLDLYDSSFERGFVSIEDFLLDTLTQLEALVYLHDAGYVHFDSKPENFFNSKPEKFINGGIADFGFTEKIPKGEKLTLDRGTQNNVSPEIMLSKQCNQKTDVWSFATAIYMAFTGEHLFDVGQDSITDERPILNHLHLIEKRLGNQSDKIAKMCSPQNTNEFLTKDPVTGRPRLKGEFSYSSPKGDSQNSFTIKPFSDESAKLIFPQYLESMGYTLLNGKWLKTGPEGVSVPMSSEIEKEYFKNWQQQELNRFVSLKKRVQQTFLKKSESLPLKERSKYIEDHKKTVAFLIEFLEKALELDPEKRVTSQELLDTDLIKLARKIREKREKSELIWVKQKARKTQAEQVAKILFSLKG